MIRRLLIANRGEIAVRIIRACRELGIETVAVYSEADATTRHVRDADFAVPIGPAPARDSYLDAAKMIDAARHAGADAIHPGYGFLSERAPFARACEDAGLIFVGPPASALEQMGSKIGARRLLQDAGVPVVPGETPADQSDSSLVAAIERIGAREGLTADDPSRDVRPPPAPRRLPKALGVDEVRRLLEAARGEDPLALRDTALLEFLYATGARISEAVGCSVDDLDLADGSALLRGKGGRSRVVPVGGYARAAVEAYLVRARPALLGHRRAAPARPLAAGRDAHVLFRNGRGGPLTRQGAWSILRAAAVRARLSGHVTPHSLRHSFATHLLDGGADVRVVQELLGHASVTTTQVYTLVTVEKLREIYAVAHPRSLG